MKKQKKVVKLSYFILEMKWNFVWFLKEKKTKQIRYISAQSSILGFRYCILNDKLFYQKWRQKKKFRNWNKQKKKIKSRVKNEAGAKRSN